MRYLLTILLLILAYACSPPDTNKLTEIGIRQYDNDSLEQAIKTLSEVLQINDTCGNCLLHRGFAYKDQEAYRKAIDDFSTFITIYPNESIGFANRASVYYLQNYFDSALWDFSKAYEIDSSEYYLNPICHMLYVTGQEDSACAIYFKLVAQGDTTFDEDLKRYCDNKVNR